MNSVKSFLFKTLSHRWQVHLAGFRGTLLLKDALWISDWVSHWTQSVLCSISVFTSCPTFHYLVPVLLSSSNSEAGRDLVQVFAEATWGYTVSVNDWPSQSRIVWTDGSLFSLPPSAAGHIPDPVWKVTWGPVLRGPLHLLVPVCAVCHRAFPLQDSAGVQPGESTPLLHVCPHRIARHLISSLVVILFLLLGLLDVQEHLISQVCLWPSYALPRLAV